MIPVQFPLASLDLRSCFLVEQPDVPRKWNPVLKIVPVNGSTGCGFILLSAGGHRYCGEDMAKKKKTGSARTSASRKKFRRDGLTNGTANFGTEPDEHPSITTPRTAPPKSKLTVVPGNEKAKKKTIIQMMKERICTVEGPFYSQAYKDYRVQFLEQDGKSLSFFTHDELLATAVAAGAKNARNAVEFYEVISDCKSVHK